MQSSPSLADSELKATPSVAAGRLVLAMLAVVLVPMFAAWFAWPQHVPPGFGVFPPAFVEAPPAFSWPAFILLSLVVGPPALCLAVPRWFGFAPVAPAPALTRRVLPAWFWAGLVTNLAGWVLMWSHATGLGVLVHFAFVPLWWGFVFVLDGLVHARGGRSLVATRPGTLAALGGLSVAGWLLFEFLDYFVLGNWSYPNAHAFGYSNVTIIVEFLVCYSTVWPVVVEASLLLRTFPSLATRYSRGPRIALDPRLLVAAGIALSVAMVFFPRPLFWAPWVAPLAILAGALASIGRWTPLTDLARGDWTAMGLGALGGLFNGFFWELWNAGSVADPISNPNFWAYHVPWVDAFHIGEMPLLGFAGYLPFGLEVWVVFVWAGELLGLDSRFLSE